MASALTTPATPIGARKPPRLANGDNLTRDEFERRYAAMPEGVKAELIEGVVYMSPPVRYDAHSKQHFVLTSWLGYYAGKTPGLLGFGDNGTVRLDDDNEPQPDLFLMLPPHLGGRAVVDADDYISGAPALVCEVAASSVNIDLHTKKGVYGRNGVQEYLVWRTEDAAIDWFSLEAGEYVTITPLADGTLCSKIFPGLCVQPSSLFGADLRALFALLDKTTATPAHAEFVDRLKKTAPPTP